MRLSGRPRAKRVILYTVGTLLGVVLAAGLVTWHMVPREILRQRAKDLPAPLGSDIAALLETPVERIPITNPVVRKIVDAAHAQEGDAYDASYRQISYPNGDVPKGSGACTDVVVRSLRGAGIDLQALVHEDMTQHFGRYSDQWHLGHPDANIDHRRVPNLMVFFKKYGQSLPLGTTGSDVQSWQPGDIACWKIGSLWHTGVVSDGVGPRGLPLIIHNGWVCVEQDCLDRWQVMGHFRFPHQGKT